jgi:hypothetical protein
MLYTRLFPIVKMVRLRYAIPFVLFLIAIYFLVILPWMANWGSTAAEQQMALPGDDLIPHNGGQSTLAVTIDASAEVVWQWLVQVGQDRAGFYTYAWIENLIGADIHNTNEIRSEWQHLSVGDVWRLVPADYLGGVGKDAAAKVLVVEPGQVLVTEIFGAHVLVPIDENTTRLIVRGESGPSNLLITMIWKPIVFTLERRMLLGLKARAEGRPDAPAALIAIAQLGWIAAGITVASLFLRRRRRWFWMVLPGLAAMPALLMGHDIQAGLVAFLGLGIPVLGFLVFGKDWWGSLLIIASVVLLILLLAPEAYTVIGLAFVLLLLAGLRAMVTVRSNASGSTKRQLSTPTQ